MVGNYSNEDPWTVTNKQPIDVQIKKIKLKWIGHTSRKPTGPVEKTALDWNTQGARRCGRPRKTWRKTVEGEAREVGKTWNEVKIWLSTGPDGGVSRMPHAPEGATGSKSSQLFLLFYYPGAIGNKFPRNARNFIPEDGTSVRP
jgi:hypothetical protein